MAWDELRADLHPESLTVKTVLQRMKGLEEDPWASFREVRQSITAAMKREVGL